MDTINQPLSAPQSITPQRIARKRPVGRRRSSGISRAALDQLDAAIESRQDTEVPARDWQITRPDVQDCFAIQTRRLLRRLESEIRELRIQLRGRVA